MRLDRYLCELNIGTRSQVKNLLKKGVVTLNGRPVKDPGYQVDEERDRVAFQGRELNYRKFVYYMLNKPQGVVSATRDALERTVTDLLSAEGRNDLFPAGRLDKDAEGLLLITNDGELAHRLLSPKFHVDKTYLTQTKKPLSEDDIRSLAKGVDIGESKPTLPAKVESIAPDLIRLTIQEGKFHQVKRMLQAVDNQVTKLKRIRFGDLTLDESLAPGEYRKCTEAETETLKKSASLIL